MGHTLNGMSVAAGEAVGAMLLTEPGAGSSPSELATVAETTGEGYRLTGEKAFGTNAGVADVHLVEAGCAGHVLAAAGGEVVEHRVHRVVVGASRRPRLDADVVEREREYTSATTLLHEGVVGEVRLGASVVDALEADYEVLSGESIAALADDFGEELASYFDPRP